VKNIKKIAFIKIDKYEENKVHETWTRPKIAFDGTKLYMQ
jgi:hypothetical protein